VRSAEELNVKVPEDNLDFHAIAVQLSRELPRRNGPPLADLVRARTYSVKAAETAKTEADGLLIRHWRLHMDNDWTVPAVEISRGGTGSPVILIGDEGRAALAQQAERLLSEGRRVVAVDPFYFGESKIAKRDFLFALLVSSVGDRPLGIQASQIAAVARWLKAPASVEAFGPRSSLIAAVAASLDPKAIASVNKHGGFASLKQVIEQNMAADKAPELFCFGLLESMQ
jgi:hypothetical protein